jgi:hypothetical protein
MITILKFSSENEDDVSQLTLVYKAEAMYSVLHDLAQDLRMKIKHGDYKGGERKMLEELYGKFWDLCRENNYDPFE